MHLRLFTANYPYGYSESFLNNEVPFLKKEFDHLSIIALQKKEGVQRSFANDIEVFVFDKNEEMSKISYRDYLFLFRIMTLEFLHCNRRLFFAQKFRTHFAMARKSMILANWIHSLGLRKEDAYYSGWMNEWALALAILKKKKLINEFVFRINGYDIWNERYESGYLPFRYFNYSQTKKVIALSKSSQDYVKKLNIFPDKITYSYFGTPDFGINHKKETQTFIIFSCSSAIPLKRLDKIAEVVIKLPFKTKWIHHGEGPTIRGVIDFMSKAPDQIEFTTSSKKEDYYEVLEMEKALTPDLFINLSSTEGLPVTLMEAISFGIPLLVNDVGSCNEFITEKTGVSVSVNATIDEIVNEIVNMKNNRKSIVDRDSIRAFWEEKFSADKNYSIFARTLRTYFEKS